LNPSKEGIWFITKFWIDFYHSAAYKPRISIGYRPETLTRTFFLSEDLPVAHFLTTRELSEYLKLHEVTICKYAAEGIIPAFKIGKAWRFDKDLIDSWISARQIEAKAEGGIKRKG